VVYELFIGGKLMNYFEFKQQYINAIEWGNTDYLCELEEAHPDWAERVEDWIAKHRPEIA
jgi:hypothetical protein